jgi:hypothetical protein
MTDSHPCAGGYRHADAFPLLLMQLRKLWMRLTAAETISSEGVDLENLATNVLSVDFESGALLGSRVECLFGSSSD